MILFLENDKFKYLTTKLTIMTDPRTIAFWIIGAICVFTGALIAGSIESSVLGSTTISIAVAYIIAFILILLGGMFWISTALIHIEE